MPSTLSTLAFALPVPTRLHTFDLALIAVYLIAITLFGLRFRNSGPKGADGKPDKSLKNYFLANNTIPWWAIALSIVSAETSTLTIVSIPGVAFAGNFGFLQIVLGYMVGRIVVALLFLPRYFQGEMLTAYQLIDRRFGPTLHKTTAGLFLLTRAAAEGVRVFAISIVVGIAIGTNDTLSIAIISALTLLYTFEGGMTAVIWTDVVQMGLYIAGTLVAIATLGTHVPGGWHQIHEVAGAAGKFHIFNFAFNLTQSYTFWAGLLGGTFLTMASHGTDQLMVQRMLAARNLRESRLALLSSGAVILLQFTLFLLIGAGLFVFYGLHPETFKTNDHIFPTFIVKEMPIGIAGLLIAAILAAAMSNLSAALNSLSSTTVVDFYMHWRPLANDKERNLVSRTSTVWWALVLFAIAVYSVHVGGKGHVVETGLSIASVAYGCLLGVFLLGTLTKFATETGTIIGMICGFTLNLTLWQFPGRVLYQGDLTNCPDAKKVAPGTLHLGTCTVPTLTIPHIAFTWYVLIGALVTFAIGAIASLIFRKQSRPKATTIATLLITTVILSGASRTCDAQSNSGTSASFSVISPTLGNRPDPDTLNRSTIARTIPPTPQSSSAPSAQPPRPSRSSLPSAQPQPDFAPIDTLLNTAITAHKLPGAVIQIGHNNQVVFHQAYGLRKLAGEPGTNGELTPEPMTEDTIFDMASLTKCLATATAIMQLYEAGKLHFDDPVAKYLPDFAANGKEKVTIRQLLTHYSGLPEDVSLKDPWGLAAPDKAEGIRRAMNATLYGPPGTTFKYSDINFITLGALVEKLSGQPEDEYVRQHIFLPLHMAQTEYHPFDRTCGPVTQIGANTVTTYNSHMGRILVKCPANTWSPANEAVAPTAHDDESKADPTLNPNFDHLLRGTVHDPTTRRMGGVAGHAGVFSTAHDVGLYAQALLDKLRNNTGPFPLKQSTLQLMTSPQQPATASTQAVIFNPDGTPTKGIPIRGFGWDINTAFSRPRGAVFPIGSFGHTGFTGTSLWMDPASNTYVILLANAIHPRGGAPISTLRGEVATAAAKALGLDQPQAAVASRYPKASALGLSTPASESGLQPLGYALANSATKSNTQTGINILQSTNFAALTTTATHHNNHLNFALLTNQSGLDAQGHRTIDILHALPTHNYQLTTVFSPEHGITGTHDDEHVANETDPATHLPVISLYGSKPSDRRPTHAQLKDLDAVVIDLQDAGVHFWTYESVLGYFLEASAAEQALHHRLDIIVLDRPSLTPALTPRGPLSETESYTNFMPTPVQHAMTFGELAQYFNQNRINPATNQPLDAPLTIVRMTNWTRTQFYDETGLTWTNPSPNLRSVNAATLYPGVALLETTNISVGRGTETPFEQIAAPYLNAPELAAYLTARHLPGVTFTPTTLTIAEDANHYPFHGQTIPAVHIAILPKARKTIQAPELGIELISALHHLYPQFNLTKTKTLIANAATSAALEANTDPQTIAATWRPILQTFTAHRENALLYK